MYKPKYELFRQRVTKVTRVCLLINAWELKMDSFEEYAMHVKFEEEGWTPQELEVFSRLKTPADIQDWLDKREYDNSGD